MTVAEQDSVLPCWSGEESGSGSLSAPTRSWTDHYRGRLGAAAGRYPTEWVIRTLAGGNYPRLKLDKSRYARSRILDMGCGDGRNLPLLLDLGFDVDACEISPAIVSNLEDVARAGGWPVRFAVGLNTSLPYADRVFDYMLCCASCYYLDGDSSWQTVRSELGRVMKRGGLLVANFPDQDNFLLENAVPQADGSYLVTSDPYGLRNGIRFVAPGSAEDMAALLAPEFRILSVGHQDDDFYGVRVSTYIVVAERS